MFDDATSSDSDDCSYVFIPSDKGGKPVEICDKCIPVFRFLLSQCHEMIIKFSGLMNDYVELESQVEGLKAKKKKRKRKGI